MAFSKIIGTGSAVPDKILTNADLEKMVNTSDEWIRSRTGIRERRVAEEGTTTSDLAYRASVAALENAGFDPGDIGAIVVATVTSDYIFPSTACLLQSRLGAKQACAFDVGAGCSGFVYGLQVADGLITSGAYDNVLLVGAETISRITDYEDRTTCVLFGDGAGAVLLQRSETPGVISIKLAADGDFWDMLYLPGGGSKHPSSEESVKNRLHYIKMAGKEVFKVAVKSMEAASLEAMEMAGLTADDITLFIPHQANYRILEAVRKRMGIPEEKVYINLDRFGNTSAASVPIALDDAISKGSVKSGDKVLFCVFGAGFTWAAGVLQL